MVATLVLAFLLAGDASSLSRRVDDDATRSNWKGLERARDAAGELDEPDRARILQAIATAQLKAGRWDEARATLVAWPGRPDDDLFAALAGAARNSYADSIPALERYLKAEPNRKKRELALVWAALMIPTPGAGTPPAGAVRAAATVREEEFPTLVRSASPEYPAAARRAKVGGKVILLVVVLPSGYVAWPSVLNSSDPAFVDPAKAAVARWKCHPGTDHGKPVAMYWTVMVDFRID